MSYLKHVLSSLKKELQKHCVAHQSDIIIIIVIVIVVIIIIIIIIIISDSNWTEWSTIQGVIA